MTTMRERLYVVIHETKYLSGSEMIDGLESIVRAERAAAFAACRERAAQAVKCVDCTNREPCEHCDLIQDAIRALEDEA